MNEYPARIERAKAYATTDFSVRGALAIAVGVGVGMVSVAAAWCQLIGRRSWSQWCPLVLSAALWLVGNATTAFPLT